MCLHSSCGLWLDLRVVWCVCLLTVYSGFACVFAFGRLIWLYGLCIFVCLVTCALGCLFCGWLRWCGWILRFDVWLVVIVGRFV